MGASVGATPEGILAVIEKLNQYRNKDKNEICLALRLIDSFIAQWYDDYVRIFSRAVGLHGKILDEANETFQKIWAFSKREVYGDLAEKYRSYLVDVLYQGYYSPGKYKFKDIIDDMGGIDYISKLGNRVVVFSMTAYGGKREWVRKTLEDRKWAVSEPDITEMLNELQAIRREIKEITSVMRQNLGCPAVINEELYRRLSTK
jgi:hypothetical protein